MTPLTPSDPVRVGPFAIMGRLGVGGMGIVYLGRSLAGRLVAVKVIRSEFLDDQVFRERFRREVTALRRVSAVYTAAIVDADVDAEDPWLATAFVEGPSLQAQVSQHGPLGVPAALALALALAEALSCIHRAGLIHRDLKPGNVLLTPSGPVVIDFGIALPIGQTRLTSGYLLGTPSYSAPERMGEGIESAAGDIFSLGATLVFASTGHGLVGDSGGAITQIVRIARGHTDLDDVPRVLRPLVVRCVSRRVQDRPTAVEIVKILAGSGVRPPEPGWLADAPSRVSTRLRLGWRRRRVLTSMAMAAGIGALGVAALTQPWRQPHTGSSSPPSAAPPPARVVWQTTVRAVLSAADDGLVVVRSGGQVSWLAGANGEATDFTGFVNGDGLNSAMVAGGVAILPVGADMIAFDALTGIDLSRGGGAIAFDVLTGNELYRLAVLEAPSIVADRWLVSRIGTSDRIKGTDLRTGKEVWQWSMPPQSSWLFQPTAFGPAPDDPLIFIGLSSGISAYAAQTGRRRWTTTARGSSLVAVWNDSCLITEIKDQSQGPRITALHCVSTADGTVTWSADHATDSLSVVEDVLVLSSDDHFSGIARQTGIELWRQPRPPSASLARGLGGTTVVYVDRRSDRLHAHDTRTGSIKWRFDLPSEGLDLLFPFGGVLPFMRRGPGGTRVFLTTAAFGQNPSGSLIAVSEGP